MSITERIKASKAIETDNYDDAIAIYQSMIQKNDKDAESLTMLAYCYASIGQPETAIGFAERGLRLDETEWSLLMISARYWFGVKNWDRTYEFVCKALQNAPVEISQIPGWLKTVIGRVSKFNRFKHLDTVFTDKMDVMRDENKSNIKWAEEFKHWYEKNYVVDEDSTLH